ncbi:methylated-DNA--[protein]-cysteine S-methyltransferase [Cohnella silvisoli]|uniref:methylated-DNA--[protein]-cysteine S-methyltransferase n=1 Tax=Cohnella silvisoli TaxID=2873699 RepID=UPI00403A7215
MAQLRYNQSLERAVKEDKMYYSTNYSSPVGTITLACNSDNLVGLWLEGQKYHGGTIPDEMIENNDMPLFDAAKKWLDKYFAGEKPAISDLPLSPIGGAFRMAVWDILCEIPYGEYITYGDIAKAVAVQMGKASMSSQAVGGAVGHNPISIIIPCHRVVGANGSLTGYAGGINKKIKLLEHEGVDMSPLFVPTKGAVVCSS